MKGAPLIHGALFGREERAGASELSALIAPHAPGVSLMFANDNFHFPCSPAAFIGDQPLVWGINRQAAEMGLTELI